MTRTQHTPGPWNFETVKTSCGVCHKVGPFPWIEGKQNHACIYVNNSNWKHAPELEANARLIAKSPDMYDILTLYAYPGDFTGRPSAKELQDQARAIIKWIDGQVPELCERTPTTMMERMRDSLER